MLKTHRSRISRHFSRSRAPAWECISFPISLFVPTLKRGKERLSKHLFYWTLILFLISSTFQGCTSISHLKKNVPIDNQTAVTELIKKSNSFTSFSAKCRLKIKIPNKSFDIKGDFEFEQGVGWHIEMIGPLGIKVAEIIIDDFEYSLTNNLTNQVFTGPIDSALFVPGVELTLPSPSDFIGLLVPVTCFQNNKNWQLLSSESNDPLNAVMVRDRAFGKEKLQLEIQSDPLRPIYEKIFIDDSLVYTREFLYESDSEEIASETVIQVAQYEMKIFYNKVRLGTSHAN